METDTIENWSLNANNRRFSPTEHEIKKADSLALRYIKDNRDAYYWAKEISALNKYNRQYVGYYDQNNHRVIFLNCFCQRIGLPNRLIISASGGGSCYFEIKIDLALTRCFDFKVNAPK
jgi:hypothetical protein